MAPSLWVETLQKGARFLLYVVLPFFSKAHFAEWPLSNSQVLDRWGAHRQAAFVQFVTGTSRLPVSGTELLKVRHQRHLQLAHLKGAAVVLYATSASTSAAS